MSPWLAAAVTRIISGGLGLESERAGCVECEQESSIRCRPRLREELISLEELHRRARQSISRRIDNPPSDIRILRNDEKRHNHHGNKSDPTSAHASFSCARQSERLSGHRYQIVARAASSSAFIASKYGRGP